MERFCLITNKDKDIEYVLTKKIKKHLEVKGKSVAIIEEAVEVSKKNQFHMAIVLGGDGTMIQAAKELTKWGIPILGINLGTLGFLTEIEKSKVISVLDEILTGDYVIQKRISLTGTAIISGEKKELGLAVNDFIIGKCGFGRIITISVYAGGELIDKYVADGVILSTPTGSTAYNLSAGGPVLSPEMEAIIITPICPHSLNKTSIVVSAKENISVKVEQTREGIADIATISVDGKLLSEASTGDIIEVSVANHRIEIVKCNQSGFFERMRSKLNRN